jgi:hypothetical protein
MATKLAGRQDDAVSVSTELQHYERLHVPLTLRSNNGSITVVPASCYNKGTVLQAYS